MAHDIISTIKNESPNSSINYFNFIFTLPKS